MRKIIILSTFLALSFQPSLEALQVCEPTEHASYIKQPTLLAAGVGEPQDVVRTMETAVQAKGVFNVLSGLDEIGPLAQGRIQPLLTGVLEGAHVSLFPDGAGPSGVLISPARGPRLLVSHAGSRVPGGSDLLAIGDGLELQVLRDIARVPAEPQQSGDGISHPTNLERFVQKLNGVFIFDFYENISDALIDAAIEAGAMKFTMNPYSTGNYIQHLLTLATPEGEGWAEAYLKIDPTVDVKPDDVLAHYEAMSGVAPRVRKAITAAAEPHPNLGQGGAEELRWSQNALRSMLAESEKVSGMVRELALQGKNGEDIYWEISFYFARKIGDKVRRYFNGGRPGLAGTVSLEVDPRLERPEFAQQRSGGEDPKAWMVDEMSRQTERLRDVVPNILVKVPMGRAGLEVLKRLEFNRNVTLVFADTDVHQIFEAIGVKGGVKGVSPFWSRIAVYFNDYWVPVLKFNDGHSLTLLNGWAIEQALERYDAEEGAIQSSLTTKVKGDPADIYARRAMGNWGLNTPPPTAQAVNQNPDFKAEQVLGVMGPEQMLEDYFKEVLDGKIPSSLGRFPELEKGDRPVGEHAALAGLEWQRFRMRAVTPKRLKELEAMITRQEGGKPGSKAFTREGVEKARDLMSRGVTVTEQDLMVLVLRAEGEEKFISPFQGAIDALDKFAREVRASAGDGIEESASDRVLADLKGELGQAVSVQPVLEAILKARKKGVSVKETAHAVLASAGLLDKRPALLVVGRGALALIEENVERGILHITAAESLGDYYNIWNTEPGWMPVLLEDILNPEGRVSPRQAEISLEKTLGSIGITFTLFDKPWVGLKDPDDPTAMTVAEFLSRIQKAMRLLEAGNPSAETIQDYIQAAILVDLAA